jgi:uncharacterized membrane protein YqjE
MVLQPMANDAVPSEPPATAAIGVAVTTADLLRIVRSAGGALLVQAGLHGQLLRIEWAQEKARLLKLVMGAVLGFVCLLGLLVALGVMLLAVYWDTPYRIRAVAALAGIYGLGVLCAWRLCTSQAARGTDSFSVSRSELAADLELLRSKL